MDLTTLHDYIQDEFILKRVDRIRDLGAVMTPSLSPQKRIAHITGRANSLLGFIFRSSKNFRSNQTLIMLLKTLFAPFQSMDVHLVAVSAESHKPNSAHSKQVFKDAWSNTLTQLHLPYDCQ